MQSIAYVQQHDPNIQSRVRRRYSRECGTLAAHGFEELCFYSERLGAYSALRYLPMTLLMLFKGEVLGGHGRFDVGGSYLLMRHRRPSTIALPLGLGGLDAASAACRGNGTSGQADSAGARFRSLRRDVQARGERFLLLAVMWRIVRGLIARQFSHAAAPR